MKKLVLASNNKGKIKELLSLLPNGYDIVTMEEAGFTDEIEENGKTFFDNALIKAKTISQKLNCDAISDDSGLMVNSLFDAPGIFSARYAGEHGNDKLNRQLLLKNLENAQDRSARFHCCVVLYKQNGNVIFGEGETFGEILFKEVGSNGFGYDSIFYSYDLKKSFGEATDEEKNGVSHRRRAIENLLSKL